MAWPSQLANNLDPGDAAGSVSGIPFFQAFYDRDDVIVARGSYWYTFGTTAATSYTAVGSEIRLRVPSWMLTGSEIGVWVNLYSDTNSSTISLRLDETSGTAVTGTGQDYAFASANTITVAEAKIAVPDDTWAGTHKTFRVYMKADISSGATGAMSTDGYLTTPTGEKATGHVVFTGA